MVAASLSSNPDLHRHSKWLASLNAWEKRMPWDVPNAVWRPIPNHPANDWIRARLRSLGRSADDEEVAYYTSRSRLHDMVYAAAGGAYTAERIEQAADAATQYATSAQSKQGSKLGAPVVDVAYFETQTC